MYDIDRSKYPRGTHEAEATREVNWWDRTRAEHITTTTAACCPSGRSEILNHNGARGGGKTNKAMD